MPVPSLGGVFPYSGLFTILSTISLLHCYLGWIIVGTMYILLVWRMESTHWQLNFGCNCCNVFVNNLTWCWRNLWLLVLTLGLSVVWCSLKTKFFFWNIIYAFSMMRLFAFTVMYSSLLGLHFWEDWLVGWWTLGQIDLWVDWPCHLFQ